MNNSQFVPAVYFQSFQQKPNIFILPTTEMPSFVSKVSNHIAQLEQYSVGKSLTDSLAKGRHVVVISYQPKAVLTNFLSPGCLNPSKKIVSTIFYDPQTKQGPFSFNFISSLTANKETFSQEKTAFFASRNVTRLSPKGDIDGIHPYLKISIPDSSDPFPDGEDLFL